MNHRSQLMISAIMFGLLFWGAFLAIGATGRTDLDLRKGFIVFGFTVVFLLFWGGMLALRNRRLQAEEKKNPPDQNGA